MPQQVQSFGAEKGASEYQVAAKLQQVCPLVFRSLARTSIANKCRPCLLMLSTTLTLIWPTLTSLRPTPHTYAAHVLPFHAPPIHTLMPQAYMLSCRTHSSLLPRTLLLPMPDLFFPRVRPIPPPLSIHSSPLCPTHSPHLCPPHTSSIAPPHALPVLPPSHIQAIDTRNVKELIDVAIRHLMADPSFFPMPNPCTINSFSPCPIHAPTFTQTGH